MQDITLWNNESTKSGKWSNSEVTNVKKYNRKSSFFWETDWQIVTPFKFDMHLNTLEKDKKSISNDEVHKFVFTTVTFVLVHSS